MNNLARLKMVITAAILLCLVASMAQGQSLWDPSYSTRSLFADNTARGVGDILTIVVNDQSRITNDEQTRIEKGSTLDSAITNFNILPNLWEPLPSATASSDKTFEGRGTYDKDNQFETTISVVVIDSMPNGNMLVEGTRSTVIDGENKIVKISGLVRSFDVTSSNTVTSNQVANIRISYQGTGPLNRATNRGWFSRLLDIVWPF